MKRLTIKSWALDDRPREKLISKGISSLSNAELIAILIGSGNRYESAVDVSKRILESISNNLNELGKLSISDLQNFKGIGEAKAISIVTALELGKRRQLSSFLIKPKITCSKDVFDIMHPELGDCKHEEFWVLYLNNNNKVTEKVQLSKGGLTATMVDVRLLYQKALQSNSVAIILCHNHPSGKLRPSHADIELTKKIKMAGITLDIKVLDHIIVTENQYCLAISIKNVF